MGILSCLLEKDRRAAINEIYGLIRKNGIIYLQVDSIKDMNYKVGKEIEKNTFLRKGKQPLPGCCFHYFSKHELSKEFRRFRSKRIRKIRVPHLHDQPHTHILYELLAKK